MTQVMKGVRVLEVAQLALDTQSDRIASVKMRSLSVAVSFSPASRASASSGPSAGNSISGAA